MTREICDQEYCTGCFACMASCPVDCISARRDEEGFLRPIVDESSCIDCGLCKKVCPVCNPNDYTITPDTFYLYRSNDIENMKRCSSGGAFADLVKTFFSSGFGVVYGVVMNDDLLPEYRCVDSINELGTLSGSKYCQAIIGDTYSEVSKHLKQGNRVVFCGTPCQVDGLRHHLRNDCENLLCIELICHGVASPTVFKKYISWLEAKNDTSIIEYRFTKKMKSWLHRRVFASFTNGKSYSRMSLAYDDAFMTAYFGHYIMRPSCYNCRYTRIERTGDITIGDAWGVENEKSVMYYASGVSLIIPVNAKGQKIVEDCRRFGELEQVSPDVYLRCNPQLTRNIDRPKDRDELLLLALDCNSSFDSFVRKLEFRKSHRRLISEVKAFFYSCAASLRIGP